MIFFRLFGSRKIITMLFYYRTYVIKISFSCFISETSIPGIILLTLSLSLSLEKVKEQTLNRERRIHYRINNFRDYYSKVKKVLNLMLNSAVSRQPVSSEFRIHYSALLRNTYILFCLRKHSSMDP